MAKTIIVLVSLLFMVAGCGMMAVSEFITPSRLDKNAVDYVVNSGVRDADAYEGYPNLDKANRLVDDVDNAHEVVQFNLQQRADKDNLDYSIHRDVVVVNRQDAMSREEQLFAPNGLLSTGMALLGVGGLSGFVGLMRRKPGDWSPDDVDNAIAEASGKTTAELSAKQKQVIQLVQGIQQFMNLNPQAATQMKPILNQTQDTDTQIAVSSVKAELNL